MQIKILRTASVYSRPSLDKLDIADSVEVGDHCMAISLRNAATAYGDIAFWHILYGDKTGYIKDFLPNIEYNEGRKPDFMIFGADSASDMQHFADIKQAIANRKTALAEQIRRSDSTLSSLKLNLDNLAHEIDSLKDRLRKRQTKAQLGIDYFNYWYPEYSSAVTIKFAVTNYSKSPIKYITFNVIALDAVGGRLYSLRQNIVKLKGIGPIPYLTTAEYKFDRAFWSEVIDVVKVSKIDIEYMNGQKRTVVNISDITGPNNLYEERTNE